MPSKDRTALLADAAKATRETRTIDFKSEFDPTQTSDWCELLKDIFAFANSGGGVIVVGVDGKGQPTGFDCSAVLALDPATVGDKVRSYTGTDFDNFEITACSRGGQSIGMIRVGAADTPVVPIKPGTYSKNPPKQTNAFSVGVVYVRHGAKSEPATTADLARVIERRVSQVRRTWMTGIKKVTAAPSGGSIEILHPKGASRARQSIPYRLVLDDKATAVGAPDFDKTHPHRTMECLKAINSKLSELGIRKVSVGDIKAVVAVHGKGQQLSYTWKSNHGPRQYSQAFVDWMIESLVEDKYFAMKAKLKLRRSQ